MLSGLKLLGVILLGAAGFADATGDEPFLPKGLALGSKPAYKTKPFKSFTLDNKNPVAVLDYGHIVGGVPFFDVKSLSGPAQIELKYAEEWRGLNEPFSDGPLLYGNQLSNNFRIETLNITKAGRYNAFLTQGGQRWESLRLVNEASIKFDNVGFHATFPNVDPDQEPGFFECSDKRLNEIWKVGVRGAQSSCLEQGSQPPSWRVDAENGALIESLRPIQSEESPLVGNHTLEFETKIQRGGLWYGVAWEIGKGGGIGLQITGDLPKATTFKNHNYTLSPRNTLQVTSGWGQVNQTTLPTYLLKTFDLPFPVHENEWYKIRTTLKNGYLSAYINDAKVFNMSLTSYRVLFRGQMKPITLTGRFGLGAYQDQKAYYRNVRVHDDDLGKVVYESSLKSDNILDEYGVRENLFAACLDGPKRDRLIWLGDYYHTSRIIGVSTSRFDLQRGTFESLIPTQNEEGLFSMSAPLGYQANITIFTDNYGLEDYQLLGLLSLYYYIQSSNDLDLLKQEWKYFERVVDWSVSTINKTDGLVHLNGAFTGPAQSGSSVSCMTAQALHSMAELAEAIGKKSAMKKWKQAGDKLIEAIRKNLWNEELGVWKLSTANETDFSVNGIAFCTTSKAASRTQATRSFKALDKLALGPGYLDNTRTDPDAPTASISPNTNGFLLPALFESGAEKRGSKLIDTLWGPMIDNIKTASGASWEYVLHDGSPGLGLFTSLGHPWGGAATYVLTEWAAGLRPAEGIDGYGYRNWVVGPEHGLSMGLTYAHGRLQTAFGGKVEVTWKLSGDKKNMVVTIKAPKKTSGVFKFKGTEKKLSGKEQYDFTVKV
ncbi:Six-hairpin glycosidase-like protein [Fusarium flagelliforme]|uniref:Rhaa is able to hydrolyze alpha-1 n=1 Tax=Fusarium flagelliforme TaxID=2675880 RepID=A0A395N2A3_9HYPO|nr:Six-hairpin glycosidase-like protein [Fusarium flagelliforme]KAH7183347.1 Six-hairpin glycosidase-like protein [Fusarium flagelliforme]RFN54234.1 rhaa is able to hydrolyze alpha-1 [Fusarium flagelliforme]